MPGTNPEELQRELSQDAPSDCNVLGQDMPGVSCVQWLPAARNPRPCDGDLPAKSLFVNSGSTCTLYSTPDCTAEGEIFTVSGESEGACSEREEGFKAYKCWDKTA
ncbi:hypothetical protein NW762_013336 [Fusarium torreyae]|uniref:Secreted LysM effector LysM C-terminal domain-containing protein n=1 Tax=Fusarium torreyae TaxID=1237075 RepID=A0A9W8RMF1_9HYPO|nr:hypothetical protein NW762_013336 [Fusarium torreyae]